MGEVYDGIDARLRELIEAQQVFCVTSAPISDVGQVNLIEQNHTTIDDLPAYDHDPVSQ